MTDNRAVLVNSLHTVGSHTAAADGVGKNALLSVRHLHVAFDSGNGEEAVDDLSFDVNPREILAIVGESGSGKSVTALSILGLLPLHAAVHGDVALEGTSLSASDLDTLRTIRGNRIAMVFQDPSESLDPVFSIGRQLIEAILAVNRGLNKSQAKGKAVELLLQVNLPKPEEMLSRYPHQISGGQLQRVMIALALAGDPEVLIADEPTTALDVSVQQDILDLFRAISRQRGIGIVLITHDMGVVADVADRVLVMRNGRYVESGSVDDVFFSPKDDYTRKLIDSVPGASAFLSEDAAAAESFEIDDAAETAKASDAFRAAETNGSRTSAEDVNSSIFSRVFDAQGVRGNGKTHDDAPPVLAVQHVSVSYRSASRGIRNAVDDVSFAIQRGENVALVGESGSGKSTIAKGLLGLAPLSSGHIDFDGAELHTLRGKKLRQQRRRIGVVFQSPSRSLNPRLTIGDSIAEPLLLDSSLSREDRRNAVGTLLDRVQLPRHTAQSYPAELSGGQLQRASIARALSLDPVLLIADEPTSALDVSVQSEVLALFAEIQQESGFSCLFISHDLPLVATFCDRVLVLHDGELVEQGKMESVFLHPVQEYTQKLLSSAPIPNPRIQAKRRSARLEAKG
jgi:peptide/nickel transport system ATP-binding protein